MSHRVFMFGGYTYAFLQPMETVCCWLYINCMRVIIFSEELPANGGVTTGDTPYKSINKAYVFKHVLRGKADESSSFGL